MKQITRLLIAYFLLQVPFVTKAQIAPELTGKYSVFVLSKVYTIASKTKLSVPQQFELAQYFKKQDSLANVAVKKGVSLQEVNSFYNINPEVIKRILSSSQFNDLSISISQLPIQYVLRNSAQIKLTPKQVNSLSLQKDKMSSLEKSMSPQEFQKSEYSYLKLVLNEEQYLSFFTLYNEKLSKAQSIYEWQELTGFKLNKGLDSSKVVNELYNFEIKKLSQHVKSLYTSNANDSLDQINAINDLKPMLLWKLQAYAGALRISQFSYVIKNRDQLSLTDNQIDTLLARHITLEKKRQEFAKRYTTLAYNSNKYESEQVFKILNADQYVSYLTTKNQPRALLMADNDWQALKKARLVNKSSDSTNINNENKLYELRLLIAKESLSDAKPTANAIKISKPLLLKKLEQVNTTITAKNNLKNSFAW